MIRFFFILLNINFIFPFIYSQEKDDTTYKSKIILLPEVKLIESKLKSTTALDFSPSTIIEHYQIEIINPKQLSEVLIFSPGINIQNQGGLESMKTISIRGMGSMRNLIMLDGMPLNSTQNSSFDLSTIDVSLIDNIEIIRGGASSIFGGNAIGGAVNIRTANSQEEIMKVNLSYGSFNELSCGTVFNIPFNKLFNNDKNTNYISVNLNYIDSDGNYPFIFSQFGEEKKYYRENADYDNLNISFLGKFNINNWNLISRYIYSTTDKGVPGAVLQGQINICSDRLLEQNHIFLLHTNCFLDNTSNIKISGMYKHNNILFNESSNNYHNISTFILDDIALNSIYNFIFWNIQNEFLVSLSYSKLMGDMLDPAMNNNVNRGIIAVGYRLEKDFLINNNNSLRFNLSGRYDKGISIEEKNVNKSALTGNFGTIFSLKNIPLSLRTNISHDFRFPNFNEMYYKNYGTKDLLPETSNNFNIGVSCKLFDVVNINLDGFYLDVKDMIIAIPTSPISWSAQNISRAKSLGTEFSIVFVDDIKLNNFFSVNNISFSYTLQQNLFKSADTQTYNKQLPYIPNELGSAIISFKIFDFIIFGGKLEYSSHRYYQADNSVNAILPNYNIMDLFIGRNQIKLFDDLKFDIRLDIKNILNTQYAIINNYIMPSRQFRLNICVKY